MSRMFALLLIMGCVEPPDEFSADDVGYRPIPDPEDEDDDESSKPEDESLEEGMLAAHNAVRRPLGIADLEYDDELAAISAAWVQHLEEQEDCRLKHNVGSPEGENLYWTSGKGRIERVVEAWAEEEVFYDYDTNRCAEGEQCGHYTQIVWADTEEFGCAARKCASGPEIWMCAYLPPGNVRGRRPY